MFTVTPITKVVAYSDGWVTNNGQIHAEAGGSTAAYNISTLTNIFKDTQVDHALVAQTSLLFHEQHTYDLHHHKVREVLPAKHTNNTAEALSLYLLILELKELNLIKPGIDILILLDSELILNQVLGLYRTNQQPLKVIYKQLFQLLDKVAQTYRIGRREIFQILSFLHIPGTEMKKTIINH